MSYAVDANVLIYAADRGSPHNAAARRFLASREDDPDALCLAWTTLMAYVRITTNPRFFDYPLTPGEALANVEALLRTPRARLLTEGDGFLDAYRQVTDALVVRGDLVRDAHLAALLLQHGIRTIYTADADFLKFRFLDVRNPFQA